MNKSISLKREPDEEVLHITAHYVEQVQSGQSPHLSDYLVRYPDYSDAIVDFVAYYHALEERIPAGREVTVVSEALSEISQLALEYVWQHVCLTEEREPRKILTLLVKRDKQRLSLSDLATELDLSVDVVVQLEQREIDSLSIPLTLCSHLAQILQQPLHLIRAYFAEDNQYCAPGNGIKALQRVAEQRETYAVQREDRQSLSFREVLMGSAEMSEQQKARWCAILERENT